MQNDKKIITEDKIQDMLNHKRREQITGKWNFIKETQKSGNDFGIRVPFYPLKKAFDEAFPDIKHIKWKEGKSNTYYTYLKNVSEAQI